MFAAAPQESFSLSKDTKPIQALRLLFWLRIVAIVSQSIVIAVVHFVLGIELPLVPLSLTIGALAGWSAAVWPRIRRDPEAGYAEVAVHLLVDVLAFSSVIYFSGGPTNPFVSLYLVPISLAAISLPARLAWLIVAVCGTAYSLQLAHHVPLPSVHQRFGGDFDLHVAGMWVNFLVAATLTVFFVGRMARLVRQGERQLASMREANLRDQQIVALGTMAASTAHEINTPLSTLALLVEELEEESADPQAKARTQAMQEQIGVINERLNRIARGAGAERSAGARATSLERFVVGAIEQWSSAHPHVEIDARYELPADMPIIAEHTIEQAMRNVLDNAAQAASAEDGAKIEIIARCRNGELTVTVLDQGAGLSAAVRDSIGSRIASTKRRGLGMGLLLSRASLERFGGGLDVRDRDGGGVEARILLPLSGLLADAR
jgi:two-component system sensor histidine kinase RegB